MLKRRNLLIIMALGVLLPSLAMSGMVDRAEQWKKVQESMRKGLPRSAIQNLEPIITSAMKEKAYPEALKAIARKISLEGNIQGNKPDEKIKLFKAEIAKAPPEMLPVMETVLANWYWHFFQQNRWRFMQRTITATEPGEDILSWDLPRVMAEVDKHFQKALSHEATLKKIAVGDWDAFLEKGTAPDSYRPTLYDFIANNALAFYMTGEQAGAKAEDSFEMNADSPIFAATKEFLAWKPAATELDSRTLRAVHLYQDLLRFHQDDKDATAFLDADLWRLRFGYNKSVGESRNARYKAALESWINRNADHPLSASARFALAELLHQEGNRVEARRIALQGSQTFPESVGGKQCYNLVQGIEAKSVNVTVERVWNDPFPKVEIRYRNLTQVHFRAVPWSFDDRIKSPSYRPEILIQNEHKAILAKKPAAVWSANLEPTSDYHEKVNKIDVPKNLPAGFYFLLASYNENFGTVNNIVHYSYFWVSDLGLITRTRHGIGKLEGFVLDARTGAPLANAAVEIWQRTNNNQRIALPKTTTNQDGMFSVGAANNAGYMIVAKHGNDQVSSENDYYVWSTPRQRESYQSTVFFTDRSLYRPGQTIQYKGISINVHPEKDDYSVLAKTAVNVIFQDQNGKEVARQQHVTNDYGSFSGSFTAPADRVLGVFILRTDGPAQGVAQLRVEEYKRPKFQVTLDKPKGAYKLNDLVSLQGKATSYTGAAVDGAKVRFRVYRQVRWPDWYGWRYWWRPVPPSPSQEIAHGDAVTNVDGTFKIDFLAKPDTTVPEKDEPTFVYNVSADVTDNTGETRSNQNTVLLGYTALKARLSAEDWQTKQDEVKISVFTSTLDDEGQSTSATVKIHRLKQPEKVNRAKLQPQYYPLHVFRGGRLVEVEPQPDPSNPMSWELGEVAVERDIQTDEKGKSELSFQLGVGAYMAVLETKDKYGKKVSARKPIMVLDPTAKKLAIHVPFLAKAPKWSVEPGQDFRVLWGSGYDQARAFVEIEHREKLIQKFWTSPDVTQQMVTQSVGEGMRGGFTVRVTMIRENRAYFESRHVDVPWSNKNLTVKWERFLSKLEPAQKVTWTAIVTGPDAQKHAAEMVAGLYDESLDQFYPHQWMSKFQVFRQDFSHMQSRFENSRVNFHHLHGNFPTAYKQIDWRYRQFPADVAVNLYGYQYFGRGGANRQLEREAAMDGASGFGGGLGAMPMAAPAAPMDALATNARGMFAEQQLRRTEAKADRDANNGLGRDEGGSGPGSVNPGSVTPRKNLQETAFFFPHLESSKDGEVRMTFTMPEALTKWKFQGFVHDKQLRSGYLTDSVVTARELMIQPNAPRFVRETDLLDFTVKVTNLSEKPQTGQVRLTFADARTGKSVDAALANVKLDQSFNVPAKESRSYAWRIKVPYDMGFLTYKATGSTDTVSDGEEGYLPVLSSRVLVTESLPLPIRGPQTKTFKFGRLLESGKSDTLKHQNLSVQMVSQPAWYAVMALPYLMEYPYQCSEQIFNRLYANGVARHVANSDPKIRNVFNIWKNTPATLDSPLFKNADLRSVMIEETPWLRQAQKESEARRNVGILFDDNRLDTELQRAYQQLAQQQLGDGSWPWFPGGPSNDYITLYITTGFGRMRNLGVNIDQALAIRALGRLDTWVDEIYRDIVRHDRKGQNNLSPTIALYLYGRSFFLNDRAIQPNHKEAVNYFIGQAKDHWLKVANRQSQAHLALALNRFGEKAAAQGIMASLKERSVSNEELGMFWRDLELSWWWFRAPIETQALMIEAFDEVMNDRVAVEDCKVWLLKQKQTQDWKTTKGTADACYALLLKGRNALASDALVEVQVGDIQIKPEKVEAGTGFYEKRFLGAEIKPSLGEITVKKTDEGVSWGSVTWQYLDDISKITPYEGTPLTLKKKLFQRVFTKKGPTLQPIAGALKPGDEVVVRLELRVDRDMEYVHLKDTRGSGTEPTNVLSQYKYQDGLRYYEMTRDTASHFFIDYLPKGTYVFEYSTRMVHKGQYQTGMAEIQSMYAPEFNSHSESYMLTVE